MIDDKGFFEECSTASRVKQFIIEKYFTTWASIMVNYFKGTSSHFKIAYIDLFAGPGVYDDGTESTPILVVNKILANPAFYNNIMLYFNDMNADYINRLQDSLSQLPGYEMLRYKPVFQNYTVDEEIVDLFTKSKLPPSLVFIDPCGYEGFSLDLVYAVIKDFGCDCIAFFNYNRINMHISNHAIPRAKLDKILNCDTEALRDEFQKLNPRTREERLLKHITVASKGENELFVLPFKFKSNVNRTSHYLLFFSHCFLGYDSMKKVMYDASKKDENGIALYQFDYENDIDDQLTIFFKFDSSFEDFKASILHDYRGRSVFFNRLYEEHSVGRPFVRKQYKSILKEMEDSGLIKTDRRTKKGFADHLFITFPDGEL